MPNPRSLRVTILLCALLCTLLPGALTGSRPADAAVSPLPFTAAVPNGPMVFAHYFPPYPVSLDNQPPAKDYYARNYLRPEGEGGKFAAYGGLLRDRPVPRDPRADYRLADAQDEIRQARAAGINGFAVDLLNTSGANHDRTKNLIKAAEATKGGFVIMLQPDMTAGYRDLSNAKVAAALAELADSPAIYRIGGKVVISPFYAEKRSPAWWKTTLKLMSTDHRVSTAFYPMFLNAGANLDAYASISVGFSEWGARDVAGTTGSNPRTARAHKLKKKWMQPVSVQDYRPHTAIYDEARNTTALRESWRRAIYDKADAAILLTWNDYSESTSFAPSTDHGYSFLDLSAYYASRFHSGNWPKLTGDALYLTHRTQRTTLRPAKQTRAAVARSTRTPASNQVEVLSLLRSPATVEAKVGGKTYRWNAPAGMSVHYLAMSDGAVSATARRGSSTVATVRTASPIVARADVQDLSYHSATSRRALPRQR